MALVPFRIGPGIRLHDGILNVCAYDALNWWDYLTVGWKLFRRDYHNQPLLKFWPVRYSVRIEANPSVPVQGDGEPRTHTPVLVEVVPEAVQVISPRGTHS